MKTVAAKEAKMRFGVLMNTVQHEPVTIEKHGRPVAVVLSVREYEEMKMARLRAEPAIGEDQADGGEFADNSLEGLNGELDSEAAAQR
jgi:prevent-host-death family protein